MECAELEIGLFSRDVGHYTAELGFTLPNSAVDIRRSSASLINFDQEQLRALELNHEEYGSLLGSYLFADPELKADFSKARNIAQSQEIAVRMRLFIGPNASELHNLRWEALRAPDDGASFFTSEQFFFSRYLSSYDWRPVRLRPRGDLTGLVAVASPTDLDQYEYQGHPLRRLDIDDELARARSAMEGIPLTELAAEGSITLEKIFDTLKGGYDFLYLVCHGALIDGTSWLWLESKDGTTERVPGRDFLNRLQDLSGGPRLVVLASCQRSGTGNQTHSSDGGALAALGPRMAAAGTPAVVAMQGSVTLETLSAFMPVFFRELQRDGQIDRAMAVARKAVEKRPDWWAPVLFMRLKSGRIWYATGFAGKPQLKKWPALVSNINSGKCTPILGPSLTDTLLGSRRELAQRWARTYHFPMAPHLCDDLPQVAQFLAIDQQLAFPQQELIAHVQQEMLSRYGSLMGESVNKDSLDEIISAVGMHLRKTDDAEPHRILARLPLPIFITTNFSNLMADALADAGKTPVVEFCRWKDDLLHHRSIYDDESEYSPTPERPLVYHLFGRLNVPESLVLTEDDYFDYLIGATRNRDLIPVAVRRALTDNGMLILGYHLDDWNFRVLFRSFLSLEGGSRRVRYAHVAAQIDPEEGRILEPERAREYLERYFFENARVSIFWGDPRDFARELNKHL